jgi:hypothetical protein
MLDLKFDDLVFTDGRCFLKQRWFARREEGKVVEWEKFICISNVKESFGSHGASIEEVSCSDGYESVRFECGRNVELFLDNEQAIFEQITEKEWIDETILHYDIDLVIGRSAIINRLIEERATEMLEALREEAYECRERDSSF